jgi:adenylate cyclase
MVQQTWQRIFPRLKRWLRADVIGMVLVGGVVVLGAAGARFSEDLPRLEREMQTQFLLWRGLVRPPTGVVILAIDDSSLRQGEFYDPVNRPFLEPFRYTPWRRVVYAQVLEKLFEAGARAVAVDVLFVTDSVHNTPTYNDDAPLQRVIDRYGDRLILAANYSTSATPEGAVINQLETPQAVFRLKPSSVALVNFNPDADGNIHRFGTDVGLELGDDKPLTFAEATLRAARIPFAPPRGDTIFYYGPADTWQVHQQQIPFFYVVDPQNWRSDLLRNGEFFKDKIVLIGATAASLQDIQSSAFGRMPGVEIHANAIATLLEDRSLRQPLSDRNATAALIVVLGLGNALVLFWLKRPVRQFLWALTLALLWFAAAYGSFTSQSLILPVVLPTFTLGLSGLTLLITGTVVSQLDKILLRRTLERYLAAPIVQEILKQPDDFKALLEGRTIKAAVLFSDIRGFTTLSSRLPPKLLLSQLNTYLGEMVAAILAHNGTLDKFIGDAVMAEFGSPVSRGDREDAMDAILAALGMRQVLAQLRQQWQAEGKIPFSNGIGINYGEVTVGNIGSPQRLEYAVIGDTVNVASRVEGMTKELGTDIVITEALYQLVADAVEVIDYGEQTLKGRAGAVRLYGLVGLKGSDRAAYDHVVEDMQRTMKTIEFLKGSKAPGGLSIAPKRDGS